MGWDLLVLGVSLAATMWLLAMLQTATAGTQKQTDRVLIVTDVI